MRRALAFLFVTSALVSLAASAFTPAASSLSLCYYSCSAPAIWSGVPAQSTTAAPKTATVPPKASSPDTQPAATTAGGQHNFDERTATSASGVWVAYTCSLGRLHVFDVLANALLWSSSEQLSGETFAPSFGADGSVYATSALEVVKFDLLNGTQLWMQGGYENPFVGPALAAADVVYVPYAGGYAVLNATTGILNTSLSDTSNLVTNGNYSAGLIGGIMQFYVDGQPVSSPSFANAPQLQAPTAANGDIFCASEVGQPGVYCVNTNKAPTSPYWMPLNTSLPFAMAGDDLVIGIDSSSGSAEICQSGTCAAMQSYFAAGVSASLLPVPWNASSSVIFGAAGGSENLLVGFHLNGIASGDVLHLNSMLVGLPAAVFDERSRQMYVAIITSNKNLYVYTA